MSTWMIVPSNDDMMHKLNFHKYIEKVKTKSGKWRYIYNRAKKKVKEAVGLQQREKLVNAEKEVNKLKSGAYKNSNNVNALKILKERSKAVKEYQKTFLGFFESIGSTIYVLARDAYENVKDKILTKFEKKNGINSYNKIVNEIKVNEIKVNEAKINEIKVNDIKVKKNKVNEIKIK